MVDGDCLGLEAVEVSWECDSDIVLWIEREVCLVLFLSCVFLVQRIGYLVGTKHSFLVETYEGIEVFMILSSVVLEFCSLVGHESLIIK